MTSRLVPGDLVTALSGTTSGLQVSVGDCDYFNLYSVIASERMDDYASHRNGKMCLATLALVVTVSDNQREAFVVNDRDEAGWIASANLMKRT